MKRPPLMRLAKYLLAGAIVTYVVSFLALSATPAMDSSMKPLAAMPREVLDVTPAELTPPVYIYRSRSLVKTYWQFSPREEADSSVYYVGHLKHIGFPFRAASVLGIGAPRTSAVRPSTSRIQRGLPFEGTALRAWDAIFPYRVNITYDNTCLPLRLLPLGFIADTAIYASFLLGLMRLLRRIRDRRRVRRGLCTKCKYTVRGIATCPECGTPVASTHSSAALSGPPR